MHFRPPPPYGQFTLLVSSSADAKLTENLIAVWCWGWDGAGDLEGPDVEPIWESFPNMTFDPIAVRHDRSFLQS